MSEMGVRTWLLQPGVGVDSVSAEQDLQTTEDFPDNKT